MTGYNRRGAAMVAAVTAGLSLVATAPAIAQEPSAGKARQLRVDVQVDRFAVERGRVVARGSAANRVRTRDGHFRVANAPVKLAVAAAAKSCQVLYLRLDDLQIDLLGLNVNTSTVTLKITGNERRVLGRLFCQLSKGIRLKKLASSARVARSLNRRLDHRPMHVIGLRAALYEQQAPQASAAQSDPSAPPPAEPAPAPMCGILDVTLGPLKLDLLGLAVDLYGETTKSPVRIIATADPNGGVLGATLCKLANGQAV